MISQIQTRLFEMQDIAYKEFQIKLLPDVPSESVIGVRTPQLRTYAKEVAKMDGREEFLLDLPHRYFDENQLHAFVISLEKDFDKCMEELERFLPYIDNWATCDQLAPRIFKKYRRELLPYIRIWLASDHTYTVRFGIGMLMSHFLDGDFDERYLEWVAGVRSESYYINMMIAWYFATALAKQYDAALPYLTQERLEVWTHNKTIQKAVESSRIAPEQKTYLKTLRRKKS